VLPTTGEASGKQIGFMFDVTGTGESNLTRAMLLKPLPLLNKGCLILIKIR